MIRSKDLINLEISVLLDMLAEETRTFTQQLVDFTRDPVRRFAHQASIHKLTAEIERRRARVADGRSNTYESDSDSASAGHWSINPGVKKFV